MSLACLLGLWAFGTGRFQVAKDMKADYGFQLATIFDSPKTHGSNWNEANQAKLVSSSKLILSNTPIHNMTQGTTAITRNFCWKNTDTCYLFENETRVTIFLPNDENQADYVTED